MVLFLNNGVTLWTHQSGYELRIINRIVHDITGIECIFDLEVPSDTVNLVTVQKIGMWK